MAEIPERWKEPYMQCRDFLENPGEPSGVAIGWFASIAEELGTAEARIRELEQERDRLPANWFEDSSLKTWFPFTSDELDRLQASNRKAAAEIDALQAQLQAVTQERDEYRHGSGAWAQKYSDRGKELDQLQARNSELVQVIRSVEWCASNPGECPVCGGVSWGIRAGHGASCDIGKALASVGAEAQP